MILLSQHYLVAQLDAPDHIGVVALPDDAQRPIHDYLVLEAGPGRRRESGQRLSMQAAVGERVIVQGHDVRGYDAGKGERLAFVRDEDLVAVVRTNAAGEKLEPANDYVFIEVDPPPAPSTTVAVVSHALHGAERRLRLRAAELHAEFSDLLRGWMAQGMPQWERVRRLRQAKDALRGSDREALELGVRTKGETGWDALYARTSVPAANTGRVVAWGPGAAVDEDGERIHTAFRTPTYWDGPAILLPEFSRVVFDRRCESVDLFDGQRWLAAYPVDALLAVEAEDGRAPRTLSEAVDRARGGPEPISLRGFA